MFVPYRVLGPTIVAAVMIGTIGCGSDSSGGGGSMSQAAAQLESEKKAQAQADAQAVAAEAQAAQQSAASAQQPPAEPEKNIVGGRPPMESGGYFTAIAGARRHVLNVVDSLSWIQGVRNFKGEEGRKPKNHEEFMRVVVPRYELQLPELEEGHEYLYDPDGETDGDFGQLYVVEKTDVAAPATPQ
jgi:hypothetical protein